MKKTRKKYIPLIILASILLLIAMAVVLIPKLLFADYEGLPTTGPYQVAHTSAILVDENRVETFETDGSKREVPAYFFYPIVEEQDISCPLVIFSHGAFGYYASNTSTYMELASHGYVVISLDHPYHSFFTTDTSGKTITVNPKFIQEVMGVNEEGISEEEIIELSHDWLEIRVADMSFVTTKQAKSITVPGVIKGLDNVLLASQWLMGPGGLPTAAAMGKFAAWRIIKRKNS